MKKSGKYVKLNIVWSANTLRAIVLGALPGRRYNANGISDGSKVVIVSICLPCLRSCKSSVKRVL